jgi:ribosomal protein RSM22 (predicted rRNA methylase)
MTGLPGWIAAALQGKLENVSRSDLRDRAQAISNAYRAGNSSEIIKSELDALAYAVVRLPATYAAVRAVLGHAVEIAPDFRPESILDIGCGPGTAAWAGLDTWPSVMKTTLIDRNPRLLDLARDLRSPHQTGIDFIQGEMAKSVANASSADVVMASYALTEIPSAALDGILSSLWDRASKMLVIVEPGTVNGFQHILTYRDLLLSKGARIIAPCSHDSLCPLANNERWCHFGVRLPRSRDHLIVKDADVPFEDEKYSYLVAGKDLGRTTTGHRVLATPKVKKAAVTLTLCAPEHVEERIVERRQKDAYKAAKRLDWGDTIDL